MPSLSSLFDSLKEAWSNAAQDLFERDGLEQLFTSARNLLTGTVIVAAGLRAAFHEGDAGGLPGGLWALQRAGWVALVIGLVMLALNLTDGMRRLAQRRSSVVLRVAALLLYLGISLRLTQVIVLFRYGGV